MMAGSVRIICSGYGCLPVSVLGLPVSSFTLFQFQPSMNPAAFLTRNSAESLLKEEKNAVEGRLLPKLAQQHKYSVFFPSLCSFILSFSFSFPPPSSSCSLCSFEFCCLLFFSIKIVLSDYVFDFSNSFSPF